MRRTRAAHLWLWRWLAVGVFAAFVPDARADPAPAKVVRSQPCVWSYSATLGFSNDNLLAPSVFAPKDRIDPGSPYFADDDGRTFGLVFEQVLTNERRGLQFLTSSWYEMLTQDGAQEDPRRNLRADMLNNIVQANQRFDLGWGLQLTLGLGVGVQTVGDLNGIALQSWWHTDGGFGGRPLGWGLQDNYGDMQGSRTVPAISQGVRLGKLFGPKDNWHATLALDYSLLMALGGIGMSFGQAGLRGRAGHAQVVQVWAGVFTSGGTTNNGYLRFAPIAQGLLGYEIGLSLDMLRKVRVPVSTTVSIQSNGSGFADTTFTIGFILGSGALAWVRPPR
jgi:hypothetical protein